jgi:flagellar motor switch protein FliG
MNPTMIAAPAAPAPKSARKAAILLAIVGNDIGASILRQLSEEDANEVAREVAQLSSISEEERNAVLEDFLRIAENIDLYRTGGLEYAKSVLYAAFGPETGKRMTERLAKPPAVTLPGIETLRNADPQNLAKIISREHPQTIALILCQLNTKNAATLLGALPAEMRPAIIRRMAALDQVSPEVIDRLANTLSAKLQIAGKTSLEPCGGVQSVVQLLNGVESSSSEEILTQITSDDPALAQTIRQRMFVFADLLNISKEALQTLVGQADRRVLTLALKGTSGQMKKRLTSIMSSRAAEMLEEDLQALGPVRIRDVEEAQMQIMALAAKLQADGTISLKSDSTEEYVM